MSFPPWNWVSEKHGKTNLAKGLRLWLSQTICQLNFRPEIQLANRLFAYMCLLHFLVTCSLNSLPKLAEKPCIKNHVHGSSQPNIYVQHSHRGLIILTRENKKISPAPVRLKRDLGLYVCLGIGLVCALGFMCVLSLNLYCSYFGLVFVSWAWACLALVCVYWDLCVSWAGMRVLGLCVCIELYVYLGLLCVCWACMRVLRLYLRVGLVCVCWACRCVLCL